MEIKKADRSSVQSLRPPCDLLSLPFYMDAHMLAPNIINQLSFIPKSILSSFFL